MAELCTVVVVYRERYSIDNYGTAVCLKINGTTLSKENPVRFDPLSNTCQVTAIAKMNETQAIVSYSDGVEGKGQTRCLTIS